MKGAARNPGGIQVAYGGGRTRHFGINSKHWTACNAANPKHRLAEVDRFIIPPSSFLLFPFPTMPADLSNIRTFNMAVPGSFPKGT